MSARPPRSVSAVHRPTSRRRAAPPSGPDPRRLAEAVAHAFLEVEAGRRPLSQLLPVLSPSLAERLRSESVRRTGPGPAWDAIVAVRSFQPAPTVCDVAVVVRRGTRVGVLVLRLERHRGAWRVVELARPEDAATNSVGRRAR